MMLNIVEDPADQPRPLRLGIIAHGTVLPEWQARCVQQLLTYEKVEVSLLIVERRPSSPEGPAARHDQPLLAGQVLWRPYWRFHVTRRARALQPTELAPWLAGVPRLHCTSEGQSSDCLGSTGVAAIRAHRLDFILHFGCCTLRGGIMEIPRYGVWAFRHGDRELEQGSPRGFWEIYHREATTSASLVRLAQPPGGGTILHRGHFKTVSHSYVGNLDRVLLSSAGWPAHVCAKLRCGLAGPLDSGASLPAGPAFGAPTNRQVARFFLQLARRCLTGVYETFRSERWNVGIVDAPIHAFLEPGARPPVRWLPEWRAGRFIADPF